MNAAIGIDNSDKYPVTYRKDRPKTHHRALDDSGIEIVEVLGEYIQLARSETGQYCLIIEGRVIPL